MFSALLFSTFTCDKCREIVRLTEKILELETRIQTLIEDSKNVRAVDTALDATSSGSPVHCSVPDEPVQQGNWVTVRRHSHGSKHCSSVPIKTLNRFSPLSDTPTEKPDENALVIGDSIVRNVKIETPATILANLKVLANAKRKFSMIVIHVGTNDVRLRQSEITKNNVKEVCKVLNTMSDTVLCSGLLPAYWGDEIHSRLLSLNGWMSNGAFPLRGTTRFGKARYGTARLSSGRFAFPPQFSTTLEWAGLFRCRYS